MRWPWSDRHKVAVPPPARSNDDREERAEVRAAIIAASGDNDARWPSVTETSRALAELHDRNHFGAMIEESFERRQRGGT